MFPKLNSLTAGPVSGQPPVFTAIVALGPDHTLRDAAAKMTEKGTGAALVFDDEAPARGSSRSATS